MSDDTSTTDEAVEEFAARAGYSWGEWSALPVSQRHNAVLADKGEAPMSVERARVLDMPAGPDKVRALFGLA